MNEKTITYIDKGLFWISKIDENLKFWDLMVPCLSSIRPVRNRVFFISLKAMLHKIKIKQLGWNYRKRTRSLKCAQIWSDLFLYNKSFEFLNVSVPDQFAIDKFANSRSVYRTKIKFRLFCFITKNVCESLQFISVYQSSENIMTF